MKNNFGGELVQVKLAPKIVFEDCEFSNNSDISPPTFRMPVYLYTLGYIRYEKYEIYPDKSFTCSQS